MAEYKWPKPDQRRLIGKPISRIDGAEKASGAAKFTYDINRPGMLHGKIVFCPLAHARIKSIDTDRARRMPGVKGILVLQKAGDELKWHGDEIAMVVAETEEQARDATRAIRVEYEPLPFVVDDQDVEAAGDAAKPGTEKVKGDPDKAFAANDVVVSEGDYGIAMIAHCCHESHGTVVEWNGNKLTAWLSTQAVSRMPADLANGLNRLAEQLGSDFRITAADVTVICQHIGGGFGSKFSADRWGVGAAWLARQTGRPVKMMLERDHELLTAGARPSAYAHIKVAAKRDGTVVAWQSHHWGTGGTGRPPVPQSVVPYVFRNIPNMRTRSTNVRTHVGPSRAWRAPNHPQGAALTMTALADMAAALHMDELEFFKKNVNLTARPEVYAEELDIAAELIGWKKKAHPRGQSGPGPVKRGLGISLHTWGGRPHSSNCDVTIHPDGSVVVQLASQDLGTGTRTVLAIVAAETLGIGVSDVRVEIGNSQYKSSGPSGGSTTVGGVSSSCRRGATDALALLFQKVAPHLDAKPDQLESVGGRIRVKGAPKRSLSWAQACAKLGAEPVTTTGHQPQRGHSPFELASQGVGGVQIADVAVDVETGVVRVVEYAAVQDQGMVIDPKTCETQVIGAVTMGITYALYEERIADALTGRVLNPNLEFYKLAGLPDVGNIKVHLMKTAAHDSRGVIGMGEPPVISGAAAISNAVANAIGVRVPYVPLTPDRVLAALEKKGGVA